MSIVASFLKPLAVLADKVSILDRLPVLEDLTF
jgi:hypothetical protein